VLLKEILEECNTDRKQELRMLCGLISLLLINCDKEDTMTAQSKDLFKIVSLRRSISLGGMQTLEDKGGTSRRQAILKNVGFGSVDGDISSKLQAARERRKTILRDLRNLSEIRTKLNSLIDKRLQDASQANMPTRAEMKVGTGKSGAIGKVTTWLFGSRPATVQIKKPVVFNPPKIDAQIFDDLAKSCTIEDQKKLVTSFKSKADSAVLGGLEITQEFLQGVTAATKEQLLAEANAACRDIHVWEDEEHLPDTQAQPLQVTGENRPAVSAIGFGDLIVARERLIGYDVREVAHIENVLPGEVRLREYEETTKREAETETETE
jgi:hypothetical protein